MPGRQYTAGDGYRYGFQGQETDPEVKGEGNSVNFKYRVHDPRLGRFLSIDPLSAKYAWNSPYSFSMNRVLDRIELEGLEAWPEDPNAGPVTRADYQQYAQGKGLELANDPQIKAEYQDCADACMLIPVMYHRDRGLPFTMSMNGKTVNSSDAEKYSGDDAFNN